MAKPGENGKKKNDGPSAPSGEDVVIGIGALGLGLLAGYSIYKAFQKDDTKKNAAVSYDDDDDDDDDDDYNPYKINKCARCDIKIEKGLKKLQCLHVIHDHCFNILRRDDPYCPKCGFPLRVKADVDNRANCLNPNHPWTGPGRPAGYHGTGDKPDLDNHSKQKNPNNPLYGGGYGFK